MRKFLFSASKFLAKHIWLYYLLNFTWGFLTTFIGLLVILVLLPFKRPSRFCKTIYVMIGKHWGGVEIGMIFLRDSTSWNVTSCHEYGHTFQNAILGPFMIFIVSIPSAIRYWYWQIKYTSKNITPPHQYDDIWFEGSATEIGIYIADNFD